MQNPVVVIGFKRADLISDCLAHLCKCRQFGGRTVYVYIDGPRNEQEAIKCAATVTAAESFRDRLPQMQIVARERNLGCRGNVISAVTEVIERYGRAIVVEEDIVVSPSFFEYVDSALDFYEDDQRVWGIDAFRHPRLEGGDDVYLSPRFECWGWATWKDRWQAVDFKLKDWRRWKMDGDFMRRLRAAGNDLPEMADLQLSGRINSWAVCCALHIVKYGMFTIEPRRAIAVNVGFGVEGTHCKADNPMYSTQQSCDFAPRLRRGLKPDEMILKQFRYLYCEKIGFLCRIVRKVKGLLR